MKNECYLPGFNTLLPGAPLPLSRCDRVPFPSRLMVSRSDQFYEAFSSFTSSHFSVENTESLSRQKIPASNFLFLAPWCLSHPGFPIFWTFIHCHSFELSFPFAVRSKLLSLRSSSFVLCKWGCTWTNLEGRDVLVERVRLNPRQLCSCPLPLCYVLM